MTPEQIADVIAQVQRAQAQGRDVICHIEDGCAGLIVEHTPGRYECLPDLCGDDLARALASALRVATN